MLHYYYSRYYLTIIFGSVFGLIYRFYDPGCLVIFHFFLFLIYSCSFLYVPVLIIFLSYFSIYYYGLLFYLNLLLLIIAVYVIGNISRTCVTNKIISHIQFNNNELELTSTTS